MILAQELYDPRVGRWLAVDPLASKYPSESPYIFGGDNPIIYIDSDGKEKIIFLTFIDNDGKETTIAIVDANYIEWDYDGDLAAAAFDVTYRHRIDLRTGEIKTSSPEYSVNINYDTFDWIAEKFLNIEKNITGSGGNQKSGFYLVTNDGGSSATKFTPMKDADMVNITGLLATFSKGGSNATKPNNILEAISYLIGNFETGQSIVSPLVKNENLVNDKISLPERSIWKPNTTNDSVDISLMDNEGRRIGSARYPKDGEGKPDTKREGKKYYNQ
jgi:hypothetical protein